MTYVFTKDDIDSIDDWMIKGKNIVNKNYEWQKPNTAKHNPKNNNYQTVERGCTYIMKLEIIAKYLNEGYTIKLLKYLGKYNLDRIECGLSEHINHREDIGLSLYSRLELKNKVSNFHFHCYKQIRLISDDKFVKAIQKYLPIAIDLSRLTIIDTHI